MGKKIFYLNIHRDVTQCTYSQFTTLDWTCDHEEADSKMFVFCKHLLEQYHLKRIIICSPDTDVAVICCYHHITTLSTLDTLWFKTGTGNKRRYIAIHESTTSLGSSICRILPALHWHHWVLVAFQRKFFKICWSYIMEPCTNRNSELHFIACI